MIYPESEMLLILTPRPFTDLLERNRSSPAIFRGLRLNDMRRTEQARPEPGQPHHQRPVAAAQSEARRRTPQGDTELMAKEQVLDFKPARRLEEVDDKMQEREHPSRSWDDSTRRCDSSDGIFGKDRVFS